MGRGLVVVRLTETSGVSIGSYSPSYIGELPTRSVCQCGIDRAAHSQGSPNRKCDRKTVDAIAMQLETSDQEGCAQAKPSEADEAIKLVDGEYVAKAQTKESAANGK